MELMDTVALMNSADYKDRVISEYRQVKTRYDRLHRMIIQAEARTLDFAPTCTAWRFELRSSALT